jgi:hypothetical protein
MEIKEDISEANKSKKEQGDQPKSAKGSPRNDQKDPEALRTG